MSYEINKFVYIFVRNNPIYIYIYIYIAADLSEDYLTFNAATTSHRCEGWDCGAGLKG